MSIRDVYYAISEMAVGDVPARNVEGIKLAVRATDCPVRLLLPSTEGNAGFMGIGTLTRTTWLIRDLCLWQPLIAGSGVEQCANDMLGYIELYQAAIRQLRNPTPGSYITSVSHVLGPVAWATSDFWAIDTTIEVEEHEA